MPINTNEKNHRYVTYAYNIQKTYSYNMIVELRCYFKSQLIFKKIWLYIYFFPFQILRFIRKIINNLHSSCALNWQQNNAFHLKIFGMSPKFTSSSEEKILNMKLKCLEMLRIYRIVRRKLKTAFWELFDTANVWHGQIVSLVFGSVVWWIWNR